MAIADFPAVLAAAQAGKEWAVALLFPTCTPLPPLLKAPGAGPATNRRRGWLLRASRRALLGGGGAPRLGVRARPRRLADIAARARRNTSVPPRSRRAGPSAEDVVVDELSGRGLSVRDRGVPPAQADTVVLLRVLGRRRRPVAAIMGKRTGRCGLLQHRALREVAAAREEGFVTPVADFDDPPDAMTRFPTAATPADPHRGRTRRSLARSSRRCALGHGGRTGGSAGASQPSRLGMRRRRRSPESEITDAHTRPFPRAASIGSRPSSPRTAAGRAGNQPGPSPSSRTPPRFSTGGSPFRTRTRRERADGADGQGRRALRQGSDAPGARVRPCTSREPQEEQPTDTKPRRRGGVPEPRAGRPPTPTRRRRACAT